MVRGEGSWVAGLVNLRLFTLDFASWRGTLIFLSKPRGVGWAGDFGSGWVSGVWREFLLAAPWNPSGRGGVFWQDSILIQSLRQLHESL